jgi:hypothetical protein
VEHHSQGKALCGAGALARELGAAMPSALRSNFLDPMIL